MKKWISGLLALVLTLAVCAGCGGTDNPDNPGDTPAAPSGIYYDITGIDPSETVMEVDGLEIPAEQYFYWLAYNCSAVEYSLGGYSSMFGELFDEEGRLRWDADFTGDMTVAQYALSMAEANITFYATIENMAKEYGVTLTDEDRADMEEATAGAIEQSGGEEAFLNSLAIMGLSRETFDHMSSISYLYGHLLEMVQEEGSDLYMKPEDYSQMAAYADHILLSNKKDPASSELLGEEELAAKRQQAEELLAQLRSAEDPEALFAQLADEYSEDPGRATNPDGYVFGRGEMVQEFEDAAFSMEPGEISDIVETAHGYHILLRKDLMEKVAADEALKAQMEEDYLSQMLAERQTAAVVSRRESITGLDTGAFYNSYAEISEAMEAANQPEDPDSAEDGEGSDAAGDGEATPGPADGTAE